MKLNINNISEIFLYMKVKHILITSDKNDILWRRLLYRDYNLKCNQDCYYKYMFYLKLNKDQLFWNKTLTQEIIENVCSNKRLVWLLISRNVKLTLPFVEKYKHKLDPSFLSENSSLTKEIIEYIYSDHKRLDWLLISINIKLTLPFVKK